MFDPTDADDAEISRKWGIVSVVTWTLAVGTLILAWI
jgi:hypothetical protein